jgi:vacuolar-type H+-ATPase catalytic subunit A/Vma1
MAATSSRKRRSVAQLAEECERLRELFRCRPLASKRLGEPLEQRGLARARISVARRSTRRRSLACAASESSSRASIISISSAGGPSAG